MRVLRLFLLLLLVLLPMAALAVQPDEVLSDPALEARAREISRNLRCVVCQNQSIDDSDAPLARDLRLLVRERLKAGDSDGQVYGFLVARYGDFVLLRPPVKPSTWLLWFGPAIVLVLGSVALVLWFRRRKAAVEPLPISEQERAQVSRLLEDR
ncbi:MAG: cytochrome [Alphaproteobacteria bacterium]|jgi:cytochrome c-type biogenesis protein CcmH|nr:cytochrome [Alphaproteobacteria bacterium]